MLHFPQQSYQNYCNRIFNGTTHLIFASQWIWQVDVTLLIERKNFPQFSRNAHRTSWKCRIFQESVHKTHLTVLQCWIFASFVAKTSQKPRLKINFSRFFPRTRPRDAFPEPYFSANLGSATKALAKTHRHALAKPHLFRAAAFF